VFTRLIAGVAAFFMLVGVAFADVDVNKGDQAALDSVKGIGPVISKRIIDERQAHGPYKNWADFENRVKGIGDKKAATLSQSGLTVNGQPMPNAPAPSAATNKSAASSSKGASGENGSAGTGSRPAAKGGSGVNNPFTPSAGTAGGKSSAPTSAPAR
jgi:competence protein ComEA